MLAKNDINHFKCFITMIRFPPNSPTYVVFVNTRSVGPLMLSYSKDIVDKGLFSPEHEDDGANCQSQ